MGWEHRSVTSINLCWMQDGLYTLKLAAIVIASSSNSSTGIRKKAATPQRQVRSRLELLLGGYRAVVIDNLENSSEIAIRRVAELSGDFGKNLAFHKVNG
ncbi:hypothetical protein Taro_052973 [Colocasia esculenta]|uniref:Uncharacterized protein n=1 Tax=Colocasia esculenta TaxID=4460 RepID=A0A843XLS2_COLES|nr:hypothetical protein [Colocasia esculenta]